jgi:hypothetical protein
LLLLRAQRTDFLEKAFEARGSDQAHESPRRLAEIPVGVRNAAWGKNRRAFLGDECLPAHGPFVLAFENLESLVFAMMDVRRRTAPRDVV